jgi:hypothetical protein
MSPRASCSWNHAEQHTAVQHGDLRNKPRCSHLRIVPASELFEISSETVQLLLLLCLPYRLLVQTSACWCGLCTSSLTHAINLGFPAALARLPIISTLNHISQGKMRFPCVYGMQSGWDPGSQLHAVAGATLLPPALKHMGREHAVQVTVRQKKQPAVCPRPSSPPGSAATLGLGTHRRAHPHIAHPDALRSLSIC